MMIGERNKTDERVTERWMDPCEERDSRHARYRALGRSLRRMFDDVVAEPVPPDFAELLSKLEAQGGDEAEEKRVSVDPPKSD